jgi:hypothetical protein
VEKVREVDADETRKRKFRAFLEEDNTAKEETDNRPSPFEIISESGTLFSEPKPELGDDVEDAIIPSPSYSPPPDVHTSPKLNSEDEDDESHPKALPQSEDFWHDVDFPPDQPVPKREFKEVGEKKESHSEKKLKGEKKEAPIPPGKMKSEKEKKKEASPFGLPGKPEQKEERKTSALPPHEELHLKRKKEETQGPAKRAPSPFEIATPMKRDEKTKQREEKERDAIQMPGRTHPHEERGHEQKGKEIERTSLPPVPSYVEPMAAKALVQATPYIQPATAALFYQMVGTMYVMAGPQGVNRTEIVLNNAAFSNSKFFGSTIQIEKYATAPDSFNITLTGSNQAVVSFKENIPSLMAAFQNGNFTFRVNRIDVQYRIERPVYRRKEGEERGESGGGDLGERRK